MKKIIIFLLASVNFVVVAQVPAYIPTLGLIGWWPFSGNANDLSGSGNNGINVGATLTADRYANPNCAYDFNGNTSHIKIQNNFFNPGWNAFTISCWLNTPNINNPNSINNSQIMYNTLPHEGVALAFNWGSSNKYSFWAGSNPQSWYGWDILWNGLSTSNVTVDTWDNFIVVKNATTYYLYKNGLLDQTFNTATAAQSGYCKMFFGSDDTTITHEYFYGKLDDFGMWNRALSQEEIKLVYHGCNPPANCTAALVPHNSGFTGMLEVYPNPNSGNFFIDYKNSDEQLMVSVSNVLGQEIFHAVLRPEFRSEISLPAVGGIYSLKLSNAENKIVFQKKITID